MFSKCLKLHLKLWVKGNLPFLGQVLEMFHKVLFATFTFLFSLRVSFLWPKFVNWPSKVHLMCRSLQLHNTLIQILFLCISRLHSFHFRYIQKFVLLRRRRSWLFYAFSFILKFVYCLLAGHLWCTHSAILCLFSTLSATTVLVSCGEICFAGFRSAIFG